MAGWPFVGAEISDTWGLAAKNLEAALNQFQPQLKSMARWLPGASAKAGLSLLMFIFSIIIAGRLQATSQACNAAALSVASRLFGERGTMLVRLGHATVLSVARGIHAVLGVGQSRGANRVR